VYYSTYVYSIDDDELCELLDVMLFVDSTQGATEVEGVPSLTTSGALWAVIAEA
jgi:hypothetical protein